MQVAGALAGQQRGGVHERETALRFKGGRKRLAGFDAAERRLPTGWRSSAFFWILPSICSEPRMGRPARMRVRNCWIEDEEGLELDLAAAEADAAARADRKDMIARVEKRARSSSAVAAVCTCSCTWPRSSANLITNSAMVALAGSALQARPEILVKSCSCSRVTVLTAR